MTLLIVKRWYTHNMRRFLASFALAGVMIAGHTAVPEPVAAQTIIKMDNKGTDKGKKKGHHKKAKARGHHKNTPAALSFRDTFLFLEKPKPKPNKKAGKKSKKGKPRTVTRTRVVTKTVVKTEYVYVPVPTKQKPEVIVQTKTQTEKVLYGANLIALFVIAGGCISMAVGRALQRRRDRKNETTFYKELLDK